MSDIAIKVDHVSKTFRIPHEKITSIRGAATSVFSRKGGYEEFKALDDVSFEVEKGEFFGIIGRNGSGKSTLLKILAGIYQSDKGKVKINGMISPFLELGIGFNPELSGRDNVYLNATVLGMTKKQIDEKFDDIVKFSELERFIDQKLKNYSSGMQVRLAFSVSIHANRDILLMDEVLAVGDSNFQAKCLEEFNRYREMGKTVILVTHDISVVQRYCHRALLLRDGCIKIIGKADEVANSYLYQNNEDEDLRLEEEENDKKNIKNKDNLQKKSTEIKKIEFFDELGERKNIFNSGEDITVRAYFELAENSTKIDFGIRIHDDEDNYMFGINTFLDKIDTRKYIKEGYFEIKLKRIPLSNGTFSAKVNIIGFNDKMNSVYLIAEDMRRFKAVSQKLNEGAVLFDYDWVI